MEASKNYQEFEGLIKEVKRKENLNEQDICKAVHKNPGYIAQLRSRYRKNGEDIPASFINLIRLRFAIHDEIATNHTDMMAKEGLQGKKTVTPVHNEEANTIESLLANNKLLGEAFLRQASAHEKEAEARIVQAHANKHWAEMNNKMMGNILSSGFELKNLAIPSLSVDKVSAFLADKYGLDREVVALELGNIAFGGAFQGKVQGSNADADKSSSREAQL